MFHHSEDAGGFPAVLCVVLLSSGTVLFID